jgi:hypothetical protein
MSIDALIEQTQWDTSWVPAEVTVIDRPELLLLSHPRSIHGLNAALRIDAPDAALPRLVDEIARHHAGRSSRVQLYPSSIRPALDRVLEGAGYTLTHRHHACTLTTTAPRPPIPDDLVVHPVETLGRLADAMTVSSLAFGRDEPLPDTDVMRGYLAACTGPTARVRRFVVYDRQTGHPLSSGGMTLFPDLSFGFLWAGGTVAEGRGRGAYTAAVTARVHAAAAAGLSLVGLYARQGTSAPILDRQGFTRHGPMLHWTRE